jgi:regulator of replication initiation timing
MEKLEYDITAMLNENSRLKSENKQLKNENETLRNIIVADKQQSEKILAVIKSMKKDLSRMGVI